MLHIPFIGGKPSHFKINSFVQAFIISESIFWSGCNIVNPIFAVFVAERVLGGSIEAAASSVTVYMIARVVSELFIGRLLVDSVSSKKLWFSIVGILVICGSYLGFAFTQEVFYVFLFQGLAGFGFGVVSPAKYALFSQYLDRGRESTEWGIYDAAVYSGMAFAAMLGGLVAARFGFQTLFLLSAAFVFLGAVPYLFFVRTLRKN